MDLGGDDSLSKDPKNAPQQSGIGHSSTAWLQSTRDMDIVVPHSRGSPRVEQLSSQPNPETASERRRRGRPRVSTTRNESAIEKRRAQIRNAQRNYQQRKERANQAANQRCDEILQAFADLSAEVEDLITLASKTGILGQDSDVGTQIRRLRDSYNAVISRPCLIPGLKLRRVNNGTGLADKLAGEKPKIDALSPQAMERDMSTKTNPLTMERSLVRGDGGTLTTPYSHVDSIRKPMDLRNIFDVVPDKHAQFSRAQSLPKE